MSDDAEYWKSRARQWEGRAKDNSRIIAELESALRVANAHIEATTQDAEPGTPNRGPRRIR